MIGRPPKSTPFPYTTLFRSLKAQPLVKATPKKKPVDEARIHAGNADHTAASGSRNALAQCLPAGALDFQSGEDGLHGASLGLKAHSVNRGIHASVVGIFKNKFGRIINVRKIDRYHAICLFCKFQTVNVIVHHENGFSPKESRT